MFDFTLSFFRCLEALGEWGPLHEIIEQKYSLLTEENRQKTCRLAAASAFGLHNFESLEQHVKFIPQDSQDGAFYRAILAIHKEQVTYFQRRGGMCGVSPCKE